MRSETFETTLVLSIRLLQPATLLYSIGGGRGQLLGGHMASVEHEPITGVWGQSPQRGPGADPLVRGAKPPEAESILVGHWMSNGADKFSSFPKISFRTSLHTTKSYQKQYALLRFTGVRVGGPECIVPPTQSLGGCPPPGSAAYVTVGTAPPHFARP